MNIFISYFAEEHSSYKALSKALKKGGHNAYPKHLKGFFGSDGLHDPDELDEHLRDEDLAIPLLSKKYMADIWLQGEISALLTLEKKLRPNSVLPMFMGDITDEELPPKCLIMPYVDARGKSFERATEEVLEQIRKISTMRLAVFISHSSKDEKIAEALGDLFRAAFKLGADEILASSVSGHRLALGAPINETLRRKIREAKTFVGIATESSVGTLSGGGSFYVAAEWGARWGMKRHLSVMLAAGATGDLLRPPFSEMNVLSCDDHSQVQQFIRQLGRNLGWPTEAVDAYDRAIRDLVATSAAAKLPQKPKRVSTSKKPEVSRRVKRRGA